VAYRTVGPRLQTELVDKRDIAPPHFTQAKLRHLYCVPGHERAGSTQASNRTF